MEKKRVRPTWAMVRDLEAKLASQIEGTSHLVASCDAWRVKYRELKEQFTLLDKVCTERTMTIERLLKRGFWSRVFNKV